MYRLEVQSSRDTWGLHPDQVGSDLPPSRKMLCELIALGLIEREEENEKMKAMFSGR